MRIPWIVKKPSVFEAMKVATKAAAAQGRLDRRVYVAADRSRMCPMGATALLLQIDLVALAQEIGGEAAMATFATRFDLLTRDEPKQRYEEIALDLIDQLFTL